MPRILPLLLLLVVAALPARAQDPAPGGEPSLEEQFDALRQRIDRLETKVNEAKLDGAKQDKAEAERDKVRLTLTYNDGFKLKTPDGRFSMHVHGQLIYDNIVRVDQRGDELGTGGSRGGTKMGRTYLGVEGTLYTYWRFIVSGEYHVGDGGVTALRTNWIENRYLGPAAILRVGQMPTPFGLEGFTQDKFNKPIGRSMVARFFNPQYGIGWQLRGSVADGRLAYWLMAANGDWKAREDSQKGKKFFARLLARPFRTTRSALAGLHIAGSYNEGRIDRIAPTDENFAGTSVQTVPGTAVITYASDVLVDGRIRRIGVDSGWTLGSFGIWGEWTYFLQEVSQPISTVENRRREVEWTAGQVTVAYLLTGEEQTFGRINPLKNAGESDGYGAWELVGRYDTIDHDQGEASELFETRADRVEQITAGLNWYPNRMVKLSLQWQHAWWSRGRVTENIGDIALRSQPNYEHTVILRVQLEF